MAEPNWAGGWRPAGFRPAPPPPAPPRSRAAQQRHRSPARSAPPSRGRRTALAAARAALDGLARLLLLLLRMSFQLVSLCLRLLLPAVGAQGAVKRAGRIG